MQVPVILLSDTVEKAPSPNLETAWQIAQASISLFQFCFELIVHREHVIDSRSQ